MNDQLNKALEKIREANCKYRGFFHASSVNPEDGEEVHVYFEDRDSTEMFCDGLAELLDYFYELDNPTTEEKTDVLADPA